MAHVNEVGILLEKLVLAHTRDLQENEIERRKRSANETFTSSRFQRTNQFEISTRLDGLVEKLEVLNKGDLADALGSRVKELTSYAHKWLPETLSLLLQLSDRPAHKSKIEDLVHLEDQVPASATEWSGCDAEISIDEDTGLWRNIDFADDDSIGDEASEYEQSEESEIGQGSGTPPTEDLDYRLKGLLLPVRSTDLDDLAKDQFWRQPEDVEDEIVNTSDNALVLTELQAIREVLFMLLGLPTAIYSRPSNGDLILSPNVSVRHLSPNSTDNLLNEFASIGRYLDRTRKFTSSGESTPLVQTFQAILCQRLRMINCSLNYIQQKFLDDRQDSILSLLGIYEEVHQATRLFRQLDSTLNTLDRSSHSQWPFRILESLYEISCSCQCIGDLEAYEYVASIFFESFRAYLKPVCLWMETGQLSTYDSIMFIKRTESNVPSGSLWHDQFHLIYRDDGTLHAPNFLRLAAKKIFNTGKSVDFLKQLGFDEISQFYSKHDDHVMSFDTVCREPDPGMLSPFSQLFNVAFERWIASRHQSYSAVLRAQLKQQCGLDKTLDALGTIFLFRDSAFIHTVLVPIFDRMNNGRRTWNDAFVLSGLLQSAFTAVPCVAHENIIVQSTKPANRDKEPAQRSMALLETLSIAYTLPWPIANIIRPASISIYQRVFTLLAQSYRAKHLLQQHKPPQVDSSCYTKRQLHQIYNLRTRLLYFTNTLLTHLTAMVLDPCTVSMRTQLSRASDVDAMIATHATYVENIEDQCLLTKKHTSLKQAVVSMFDLTVLLSDLLGRSEHGKPLRRLQSRAKARRSSLSSSEDDEDQTPPRHHCKETDVDVRLDQIQESLTHLLSFVTASVQSLSKSDGAACWEVLASNLTAGTVR